jgi:SET domain-containing protein
LPDLLIDGNDGGNNTAKINHSDKPNVEFVARNVDGEWRVGIFALKNIPAHCELLANYG